MARKSGFVRRHGVMRRETAWFNVPFIQTVLASTNAVSLVSSLNAAGLALRPFTVVRTRLTWHVRSDQDAADETYGASQGWAVVSDQAVAIGVTAVPTPDTDQGSDLWYVLEQMFGQVSVTTDIGRFEAGQSAKIDSKAMRKVDVGQDIVQVLECPVNSATVMTMGRFLVKLH